MQRYGDKPATKTVISAVKELSNQPTYTLYIRMYWPTPWVDG